MIQFVFIFQFLLFPRNAESDLYSKFHQNDFKIEFQRIELVSYDKSAWNFFQITTYKYNRTSPVANFTFNAKKDMSIGVEVIAQIYKFLSNEYRIFPARFEMNLCKCLEENIIGSANAYKCGNFKTCEVFKDVTYKVCNFDIDERRFPPFIPNGMFKVRQEYQNYGQKILMLDIYLKIYRPIKGN